MALPTHHPLVSVVIPCYNHGHLLQEALNSVYQQSYSHIEILVVDDGSTDNTRQVAKQNPGVRYYYQNNRGPSAARNKGIRYSRGEYLVFLDADDYLYKEAVATNLTYLQQQQHLAFVSGCHDKVYEGDGKAVSEERMVRQHHYMHLLKGNYIGMHATVMYRRQVLEEFMFDPTLRGCEEYDLYLKIARKYPVLHHPTKMAAYRFHASNTSRNVLLMLLTAMKVLRRQRKLLQCPEEVSAYREGVTSWRYYYTEQLLTKLQKQKSLSLYEYYNLIKYDPELSWNTIFKSTSTIAVMNEIIKRIPSGRIRNKLKSLLFRQGTPPPGKVKVGDLNRYLPLSTQFGYDRGGPVDRYYIENFLEQEAHCVRGRVLEIGDNAYTMRYGADNVTESDVLHVSEGNPKATLVGDISNAPHIPDNTFDCLILTQTLHLIYDFKEALHTCYRILKPGGALLLTVPYITPIDYGEWEDVWYWSFTDKALKKLLQETFPGCTAEVEPHGNVFTATAFLYGMGLQEVPLDKLKYNDPHYQVTITVKAIKS
ncbi:glycosyltransferase [Pontibacter litorisediminis]|uniref:glycosyltransferase n=1 Tax=Pontibacter litorisediminis TaxID=1846260 RepID=UPI0023EBFD43|nr:glycosyltransferase [Pontibacter litorisediminis]